MNNKHEIISFIVELMKEGLSFKSIKKTIIEKYRLDEAIAEQYVSEAFESVSFLAKNKELSRSEKRLSIIVGLFVAIICAILYSTAIIKSGYNLVLFVIVIAYFISKSVYLIAHRKSGIFLQMLCGILTLFSYLLGEYIIYASILKREISIRGLALENKYLFYIKSVQTFLTEYLAKKSINEMILVFCAVLFSISFFTSLKLRRIRD